MACQASNRSDTHGYRERLQPRKALRSERRHKRAT